jgi:hypothetical protein
VGAKLLLDGKHISPDSAYWVTDTTREGVLWHWLLTLATASAATVVWMTRFTLRALLIATTFVAVELGLIVWLSSR